MFDDSAPGGYSYPTLGSYTLSGQQYGATTSIGDTTMAPGPATQSVMDITNNDTSMQSNGNPTDQVYYWSSGELVNGNAYTFAATTVGLTDWTATALSSLALPPLSVYTVDAFFSRSIIFEFSNTNPAIADSVASGIVETLSATPVPEPGSMAQVISLIAGLLVAWKARLRFNAAPSDFVRLASPGPAHRGARK